MYQRVPHFGRNGFATESKRLKTREKHGDYRKFYCFGLSLRYKKVRLRVEPLRYKMGLGGLHDSYFTFSYASPYMSRSFDQFCLLYFCSGFNKEDF